MSGYLYPADFQDQYRPVQYPVSVAEARAQARYLDTDDDDQFRRTIRQVVELVEQTCDRRYVVRPIDFQYEGFREYLAIPMSPLRAITSITYKDENQAEQSLSVSNAMVLRSGTEEVGRFRIDPDSFPTSRSEYDRTVTVRCLVGFVVPVVSNVGTDFLDTSPFTLYADGDEIILWAPNEELASPFSEATVYHVRDTSGSTFKLSATSGGAAIDITQAEEGTMYVGSIPEQHRLLMLMWCAHLWKNRTPTGKMFEREVPMHLDYIHQNVRLRRGA